MSNTDQIRNELWHRINQVVPDHFEALALEVFRYQATYNPLYNRFLELLGRQANQVTSLQAIPHLPITLFKTHLIQTGSWQPEQVFTSSGTTGANTSKHTVRYLQDYLSNSRRGFIAQYGKLEQYAVLALLPSYLERNGSSLAAMAADFIACTNAHLPNNPSGFYLHDHDTLLSQLALLQASGTPTLLLGVTYALLDLADHPQIKDSISQPNLLTIMETGGMKGKRKEMTRAEVHGRLQKAFGVSQIHSEYGMTELLSQAYAPTQGVFYPAPTMRVHTTELNDPFAQTTHTGLLNITDLANLDSCAFICTEDLGRVHLNGSFEVIGRADLAEMRGCNLMVE